MDKKGISPLIATVLLICMTVLIAVIILAWSGVFTKGIIASAEESKDNLMVCNAEVSLNIKNACIEGANVKMLLENAGRREVNGVIVRILGYSGGYQEEKEVLISEGSLGSAVVAYDSGAIGNFKQIEILAKVDAKGKTLVCGISDSKTFLNNC